MAQNRLEEIRQKEKLYHDELYENVKLFAKDTWLQKPVAKVMEAFEWVADKNDVKVLDLGSGVGRNSIPLAQRLKGTNGKVACVDFLESAIRHLERNAHEYGVEHKLECIQSDIGEFQVAPHAYDYIVSVSALEHLDSISTFGRVLESLQRGTKDGGIHCFIINSNVRETEIETGLSLPPMFELLFHTETLLSSLRRTYADWTILRESVAEYSLEITRDDKKVLLKSDVVTWIVQKR